LDGLKPPFRKPPLPCQLLPGDFHPHQLRRVFTGMWDSPLPSNPRLAGRFLPIFIHLDILRELNLFSKRIPFSWWSWILITVFHQHGPILSTNHRPDVVKCQPAARWTSFSLFRKSCRMGIVHCFHRNLSSGCTRTPARDAFKARPNLNHSAFVPIAFPERWFDAQDCGRGRRVEAAGRSDATE
jgi:hypothetical protein